MSRRYEEIEEKARRDVDAAKATIKALRDRERAHLMMWLLKYFEDSGAMRSPQAGKPRRILVLDGDAFWLVKIARKKT